MEVTEKTNLQKDIDQVWKIILKIWETEDKKYTEVPNLDNEKEEIKNKLNDLLDSDEIKNSFMPWINSFEDDNMRAISRGKLMIKCAKASNLFWEDENIRSRINKVWKMFQKKRHKEWITTATYDGLKDSIIEYFIGKLDHTTLIIKLRNEITEDTNKNLWNTL